MVSVLAQVPRPERSLVRARARQLHRVAAREPGVTPRLRRRACVQVAAIAPQLDLDQLAVLVRYTLWTYRLDDRAEALGSDPPALRRLRDAVTAVTAGDRAGREDALLADLGRTLRELSGHDPTGEVVAWYAEAVRDAVAAEVDQLVLDRAVASGADPPTVERYLEVAVRRMNYRSFAYALLAVGDDRLANSQLHDIDSALWHASRAIRLTNDLRGAAQDEARGTLNVLGLRTSAGLAVTPEYVWDVTAREVREHDSALLTLARQGTIPATVRRALIRSLAQSIRLYRRTDLR